MKFVGRYVDSVATPVYVELDGKNALIGHIVEGQTLPIEGVILDESDRRLFVVTLFMGGHSLIVNLREEDVQIEAWRLVKVPDDALAV